MSVEYFESERQQLFPAVYCLRLMTRVSSIPEMQFYIPRCCCSFQRGQAVDANACICCMIDSKTANSLLRWAEYYSLSGGSTARLAVPSTIQLSVCWVQSDSVTLFLKLLRRSVVNLWRRVRLPADHLACLAYQYLYIYPTFSAFAWTIQIWIWIRRGFLFSHRYLNTAKERYDTVF